MAFAPTVSPPEGDSVGVFVFSVPEAQKRTMPDPTDPTPADPTPPAGDPPTDPTPDDSAKWKAEAEKARKEAAGYREKLRAAEEAQRQAALTDEQKRAEALKAAEDAKNSALSQLQAARLETVVEREARRLGIVDGDAAYRLLDSSAVEFEDGKPTNVAALLAAMVEARPWLKADTTPPAPTGGGGAAPPKGRGGSLTLADIAKMTPAEINARKTEVDAALAKGQ